MSATSTLTPKKNPATRRTSESQIISPISHLTSPIPSISHHIHIIYAYHPITPLSHFPTSPRPPISIQQNGRTHPTRALRPQKRALLQHRRSTSPLSPQLPPARSPRHLRSNPQTARGRRGTKIQRHSSGYAARKVLVGSGCAAVEDGVEIVEYGRPPRTPIHTPIQNPHAPQVQQTHSQKRFLA